jgi:hypothetical protein
MDQRHQQLRQPSLIEKRLASAGIGEKIVLRDRSGLQDHASGRHVPPEVVRRNRGQQGAQRNQHQRSYDVDLIERRAQAGLLFCDGVKR